MKPLEKKTANLIARLDLIDRRELVLAGVSGGPDSMALLHVLAGLRGALDFILQAVYVDHGLRPAETPQEAELVKAQADSLGVPVQVGMVDVPGYANAQGLSIEDAARKLRYDFFEKVATQTGAAKIAVAHTADDQAEEVLLRLIRGTGKKGLSGMDYLREGRIIRPFLDVPKAELLDYLAGNNLPFLEDISNRDPTFLRNKIRLDLVPYLEKHFNPGIRETLRRTAVILGDEEHYLGAAADRIYPDLVRETKSSTPAATRIVVKQHSFLQQPKAIQRRLVEMVFWKMSCRPGFRQIEQVLELAEAGRDGVAHFSMGLRVRSAGGDLVFSYPQGRAPVRGGPDEAPDQPWSVDLAAPGVYELTAIGATLTVEILDRAAIDLQTADRQPTTEYLDAARIAFPLQARSSEPGDRFHPLGAPGTKKVNDWLTDQKVPKDQRRQVPVLVGRGEILALPGHRIDHRFRLTEACVKVLKVTFTAT